MTRRAIGPVDIVFFTVKLYDTETALLKLPPLIGPGTLVIPLQNGVESVDVLTRAVGREHVAGGTCYVSAVIAEPGRDQAHGHGPSHLWCIPGAAAGSDALAHFWRGGSDVPSPLETRSSRRAEAPGSRVC